MGSWAVPNRINCAIPTAAWLGLRCPQGGDAHPRPHERVAEKAFESRAFRPSLQRRGRCMTIPPVERHTPKTPQRGRPYTVAPGRRLRGHSERTTVWMDHCRRVVVRDERKPELYTAFCMCAFSLGCLQRILK